MISLGWNEYRTFRFAPATPSRIAEVLALTVRIEPTILASTDVADLYLWNPEGNFWSMSPWDSAEIRIPNPGRFVLPGGELFLSLLRSGQEVATLANVTARMDVVLLDGSKATFGPTGEQIAPASTSIGRGAGPRKNPRRGMAPHSSGASASTRTLRGIRRSIQRSGCSSGLKPPYHW